jgi:hypothetical protein
MTDFYKWPAYSGDTYPWDDYPTGNPNSPVIINDQGEDPYEDFASAYQADKIRKIVEAGKPDSTETYEVTSIPEKTSAEYFMPLNVGTKIRFPNGEVIDFKDKFVPKEIPVNTESQTTSPLFRAYRLNEDGIRKVNQIAMVFDELYKAMAQIIGIEPPNLYGINPNLVEVAQLRLRLQEAKMWATRAASVLPENQE